jgi:hypothetical protein
MANMDRAVRGGLVCAGGLKAGLTARRVDNIVDAFEAAFAEAMAAPGPNLIEVDITGMVPLQL